MEETPTQTEHEKLKAAAEQFITSCEDDNVVELLEYYEDLFREALGLEPTAPWRQKP